MQLCLKEFMLLCVFLYLLHTYMDILAAPFNFKGLFEGLDEVLRLRFKWGLGEGQGSARGDEEA